MNLRVGDRVSFRVGRFGGAGEVLEINSRFAAVREDDGNVAYPLASECTPIADAPEFVCQAVQEANE